MIDIKINITNKIANAIGTPFIVCGNSDYTVTFTFDAEWGAYQEKTARFFFVADGIEQYIDVLFSGNTCNAPVLPNIEKVLIGVYTGNLRTTTGAEVRCKRSILFGGKVHEPPTTEDVYNEILEIVGKKLGSEGGTVTGDYFKDGNTFIHEGNLDLLDGTDNLAITKTASGSAITIESSQAPLQNLKLFGKTTQNGTPTPDAPVPLVSVGDSGSFEVGVYGDNILPYPYYHGASYTSNGITFTADENGIITVNGTSTATSSYYFINYQKIIVDEILYLNKFSTNNNIRMVAYYTLNDEGKWTTVSIPKGAIWKTCYLEISSGITINNATVKPIVSVGKVATKYEPYNKQTLTMPYTLEGADGYNTEVDFVKGVKRNKSYTFTVNGGENWTYNAIIRGFQFYPYQHYNILPIRAKGMSSHFTTKIDTDLCFFASGGIMQFSIYDHNGKWGANVSTFKTWLSENNVTFVLPLETPIETPLTETELNAYRHLMTNKGTTNVLSECEDTEITYYVNKPNAQAIGSLHEQINKDYFKLQQAIISTGGN